jgi:phage shock protein PspC (stress-responsive transcriptional regulator)
MTNSSNKRLYRNTTDGMLFGVCAGLADYFNIDVVLVRLLLVLVVLMGGSGILFYVIAAIVIPKKSTRDVDQNPKS